MSINKITIWSLLGCCFVVATLAGAQSSTNVQTLAQETKVRGYWVDPSTGLMWAGKDNGDKEVNWHQAMKYCSNLRLGGYSDWRLATVDELEEIYDKNAQVSGLNPESRWHPAEAWTFHVKGGLFLAGTQWSSSRELDDRLKPSGYAWRFDFNDGRAFDGDELWFHTNKHALCVRDPNPTFEAHAPPYWIDPSSGLMWAGKDNGKDVDLRQAMSYCRDLRAAGSSGWRLPTIDELEKIEVMKIKISEPAGKHADQGLPRLDTGKLVLTADPWSSSPVRDDRNYPSRLVWYFSVENGARVFDDPSFSHARRALCVRNSAQTQGFLTGASDASARASTGQVPGQETQQLGYWIDPSTGLMWAGRDNLGNLRLYSEAINYCHELRLARYTDWRLATLEELQEIYDADAEAPGEDPRTDEHGPVPMFFHIKGNVFLTGMQWGSTSKNDGGNSSSYVWVFDFIEGKVVMDKGYAINQKRALCVRYR